MKFKIKNLQSQKILLSHFLSLDASMGILELYADSIFVGYTHQLT